MAANFLVVGGAFFLLILFSNISSVAAFDGGDAVALVTGVLIAVMGTCACFGCIAKRRAFVARQQQIL